MVASRHGPAGPTSTSRVTAADDSGLTRFDFFYFSTGVTTRNFTLPAAWAVFGVVRDAQGAPVAADVRLTGLGPERAAPHRVGRRTSASPTSRVRERHVWAAADQYGLARRGRGLLSSATCNST